MLSCLVYVSLPTPFSAADLESAHEKSELVQEPLLPLLLFSSLALIAVLCF